MGHPMSPCQHTGNSRCSFVCICFQECQFRICVFWDSQTKYLSMGPLVGIYSWKRWLQSGRTVDDVTCHTSAPHPPLGLNYFPEVFTPAGHIKILNDSVTLKYIGKTHQSQYLTRVDNLYCAQHRTQSSRTTTRQAKQKKWSLNRKH